jgi:predicted RNase H-like HicB family nuclease
MTMTTKTTTARFSYNIQAKPEGGFVASPADPAMETIEGSTREEVEQKIQAKITEMIGAQLPGAFKLGGVNVTIKQNSKVTTWAHTGPILDGSQMTNTSQNIELNGGAAPIVPGGSAGSGLRIVAFLIAVAVMLYFVFLRR